MRYSRLARLPIWAVTKCYERAARGWHPPAASGLPLNIGTGGKDLVGWVNLDETKPGDVLSRVPPAPGLAAVKAGTSTSANISDNAVHPWSNGQRSRSNIMTGSACSLASWLLSGTTAFPLTVLLVRLMSPSSFGTYALATSVSGFVVPFAAFGLQGSVARRAAEALTSEEHQGLSMVARAATRMIVYLVVFASVTVAAVSLIMSRLSSLSPTVPAFLALAPVALVAPLGESAMGLTRATFQPKIPLKSSAFRCVLLLALTISLLVAGLRSAMFMAAAQSVAVVAGVVVLVLWSGWAGQLRTRPERSLGSKHFMTFGLAVLANTTFFMAVSQLDVVFLGGFHGSAGAGAYAPVSGIADAVGALFAVLAVYALPAMTAARIRGKDADLLDLTRWTSRWGLVLCAPALGLMAAAPGPLVHLLFGNRSAGHGAPGPHPRFGRHRRCAARLQRLRDPRHGPSPGAGSERASWTCCERYCLCDVDPPPRGGRSSSRDGYCHPRRQRIGLVVLVASGEVPPMGPSARC